MRRWLYKMPEGLTRPPPLSDTESYKSFEDRLDSEAKARWRSDRPLGGFMASPWPLSAWPKPVCGPTAGVAAPGAGNAPTTRASRAGQRVRPLKNDCPKHRIVYTLETAMKMTKESELHRLLTVNAGLV
jgi:hypothetical protein